MVHFASFWYGCYVQVSTHFWSRSVFTFMLYCYMYKLLKYTVHTNPCMISSKHTCKYMHTGLFSSLSQGGTPAVLSPTQRCSPWAPWASCCCFSFSLSLSLSICLCLSMTSQHSCFTPFTLLYCSYSSSTVAEWCGVVELENLQLKAKTFFKKNIPDLIRDVDSRCTLQKW